MKVVNQWKHLSVMSRCWGVVTEGEAHNFYVKRVNEKKTLWIFCIPPVASSRNRITSSQQFPASNTPWRECNDVFLSTMLLLFLDVYWKWSRETNCLNCHLVFDLMILMWKLQSLIFDLNAVRHPRHILHLSNYLLPCFLFSIIKFKFSDT